MEIREFAERVLLSDSLEEKLVAAPESFTDEQPGEPLRIKEPIRPANLQFAPPRKAPAMPKPSALVEQEKRALAHHIMANHELQALEVMAYILCAFPDAPTEFRQGMCKIMADEQRHTRMHKERASVLGLEFGSLPVNCYIWKKALSYESVLDYLAGLPLTFEGRNLDHTLEFEQYFLDVGDQRSAALMKVVYRDEIQHVAFGLHWLRKLKPDHLSDWEAYEQHLHWPVRAALSIGDTFNRAGRKQTGMSDEFIEQLYQAAQTDQRPNQKPKKLDQEPE